MLNSNMVNFIYFTLYLGVVIFACFYLLLGKINKVKKINKKKKEKVNIKFIQEFDEVLFTHTNNYIDNNKVIKRYYDYLIKKVSITECSSMKVAKNKVDIFFKNLFYIFIASFFILIMIFKSWYVAFLAAVTIIYLIFVKYTGTINKKMQDIEFGFPEVVQQFADEYVVNSNVKKALLNVANKQTGSAAIIFERLVREMYSGRNEIEAIDEMAKTLDFFYSYAFAEILKLSLSDVGSIENELHFLIQLMQEDIEEKERKKSDLYENKAMFYLLNGITVFVVLLNFFVHPFAKELYTYTTTGNLLIVVWIVMFIFGEIFMNFIEET